jgi:hypothetical protein
MNSGDPGKPGGMYPGPPGIPGGGSCGIPGIIVPLLYRAAQPTRVSANALPKYRSCATRKRPSRIVATEDGSASRAGQLESE